MTPFGKILRREREERGWLQGELARKLNISVPYLSQLERGRRAIPEGLEMKVAYVMDFAASQISEIQRAAALSRETFEINAERLQDEDRELAHDLTASFARLSPESKAQLRKIIEGDVS